MSGPRTPDPIYKGEPLDAERGPGLGCFWIQAVTLAVLLVLTPLTVLWGQSIWVTGTLLIVTLVLLLFTAQTVIFLLRLVAADRRTRRRPLGAEARATVGDLEAGADPEPEAWVPLDLPPGLVTLFDAAAARARGDLETHETISPFESTAPDGADGDATAATAAVRPAKVRLPGRKRPTEAIEIRLTPAEGPGIVVAIRFESEGPHRYRYWDPVMIPVADRPPRAAASPPPP